MAAKPPKPPGSFLKSLLSQNDNNKNENQEQQQRNTEDYKLECNSEDIFLNATTAGTATTPTINNTDSLNKSNILNLTDTATIIATDSTTTIKNTNCNCSNISIMHLFHEMKQEFPTIPDTIVAQCVNQNCHQRENCIQILRNELEFSPILAQSYPAKVLHPPNQIQTNDSNNYDNNNTKVSTTIPITPIKKPPVQQKPQTGQQKPPLKPLKPTRTAPLLPPLNQIGGKNDNKLTKLNSTLVKNTTTSVLTANKVRGENFTNNGVTGGGGGCSSVVSDTQKIKQFIPTPTPTNTTTVSSTAPEVNNKNNDNCASVGIGDVVCGAESIEKISPKQRPTTLNLNTYYQKQQQRQRLNVQSQQPSQEQLIRQQQHQPQQKCQSHNLIKPIRKAPLPPIVPKSSQFHLNHTTSNFINDSLLSNLATTSTTTTSPISESEISVSVSLSTPSPSSSSKAHHHHNHNQHYNNSPTNQQYLQTKSPVRHRSVITLQPEPPYTRDFILSTAIPTSLTSSPSLTAAPTLIQTTVTNSSSTTSSPTASAVGSQKSFTSVNLTLRPPVSPTGSNTVVQPSTIDITAGPGFSEASGGGKSLHYSSTSYDARLGYQQNFQITVTDEGGVFSACRIRPQQQQRCLNQPKQQQQLYNNNVVTLQQNIQNSIQLAQETGGIKKTNHVNDSEGSGATRANTSSNMCLPPQQAVEDLTGDILRRQKKKRDKLAEALRARKKTLIQVEQDINLLTGNIATEGLSERLDEEIRNLRKDCEAMLRNSSSFTTQPPKIQQQELVMNCQPQQPHPQPFPRQRITRPPPRPPPPRQTSLDIIQHHSPSSTPYTPPGGTSLPNLTLYNTSQQYQQQSQLQIIHANSPSPSYYQSQTMPQPTVNSNFYNDYNDAEDNDVIVEGDDDEYEEMVEPWECNMCTFRNHPQLNICETCENVRILPGTITCLPRAISATNCSNKAIASDVVNTVGFLPSDSANSITDNSSSSVNRNGLTASNGNLEHDTNLVQQQLQHFALHAKMSY